MRILLITPAFFPENKYGGPVESNLSLCREFVKKGHEVTVYTSHNKKTETKEIEGVKVHYFKRYLKLSNNFFITPGMAFMDFSKFDAVHLSELRTFQNVLFYFLRKNKNYVISCRGTFPLEFQRTALKKIFDFFAGKKILENARFNIVSSEKEREHFKDKGVLNKTAVIPNIVSIPQKVKNTKSKKYILYLGRIHKFKGIDLLVKAFEKFNKKDFKLLIAGPDEDYLEELKKSVKSKNVEFRGFVSGKEKEKLLSECGVLVLPSINKHESFGNVALEAVAYGKPVIVSEFCGVSEYVKKYNLGEVVKADADEILKALYRAINKKVRFPEELKAENLIKKYEGIYGDAA